MHLHVKLSLTALVLISCRTLAPTPQALVDSLKAQPGAHLAGQPVGTRQAFMLNREDFVYDAKFAPDGSAAAISRLGMKSYFMNVFALTGEKPEQRCEATLNGYEFDVEALEWSPDGSAVVTVSRDGALRVVDAKTGKVKAAWLSEEPLSSVAVAHDGQHVAVGSTRGLITVLSWPALGFVSERRVHSDEVRALVFSRAGQLFSASWDRSIAIHALAPVGQEASVARLHTELKNGLPSVRAVIDEKVSAVAVTDARLPVVVVKSAVAQSVGIELAMVTETVNLPAPSGLQVSKVVHGKKVSFKGLTLSGLDIAVCDVCVPNDVQVALGQQVLERVEVASDESTKELVFTAKPSATQVTSTAQFALQPVKVARFDASVNDLSLSADDAVLGVAFSHDKGQRTREVYEREKRKEVEPPHEWNVGARVDAKTLEVLQTYSGHAGVVATAAVTPDGQHLITGGWDKRVLVHGATAPLAADTFGWAIRRVRVSADGRQLIVAAWTPQNPLNDHQSDPSAVVYELVYGADATVAK